MSEELGKIAFEAYKVGRNAVHKGVIDYNWDMVPTTMKETWQAVANGVIEAASTPIMKGISAYDPFAPAKAEEPRGTTIVGSGVTKAWRERKLADVIDNVRGIHMEGNTFYEELPKHVMVWFTKTDHTLALKEIDDYEERDYRIILSGTAGEHNAAWILMELNQ